MSFTWNLNPVISIGSLSLQWGPIALRWYSLVYVLGFILGYWLIVKFAKEGRIKNLYKEGAEEFIVWIIIGSIALARITYAIIYNPSYFLIAPWKVLFVWEGGLSFHGGLLGAILSGFWFCKKRNVSFYELADLSVLPLSLTLVFGRFANYINGELVGRVTDVTWCINYPQYEGCRHPSQFYEAGKNLLTFFILLPIYMKESLYKQLRKGTIFWLFFILYGVGRFITDFWRAPDPTDFTLAATGLIVGQWLSLLMAAIGVGGLLLIYGKKRSIKGRGKK